MTQSPLTSAPAWQALSAHAEMMSTTTIRELFDTSADVDRASVLSANGAGWHMDFAKQRITSETVTLLIALAEERDLAGRREAMFTGVHINNTEDRAVLHTALRLPASATLVVDGQDVVADVHAVLAKMGAFADQVRAGTWLGFTGQPIRTVVNIGIGGSDLGPVMAYQALRHVSDRDLVMRFVSNVDGSDFVEQTRDLDPAETLFLVASKTFTTQETMTNARTARDWLVAGLGGDAGGGGPALRGDLDERREGGRVRHRHREHVRVLGLGRRAVLDELGDRPVDHDRRRPGWLRRAAGRPACDGHALPDRAVAREPARAARPAVRVEPQLPRYRRPCRAALRPVPPAVPGLPAADDHGEQRQARDGSRRPGGLRHVGVVLGRAGHQRPALLLPDAAPGHDDHRSGLHLLRPADQ